MTYLIKCIAHVGIVVVAFIASYALRRGLGPAWWFTDDLAPIILAWGAVYGVLAGFYELVLFKNERSAWSYASIQDVSKIVQSTALTSLTFLALIFISNRGIPLPRSTLLLAWLLSIFGLIGIRIGARLMVERSASAILLGLKVNPSKQLPPIVLVGDPRLAAAYLKRHAADDTPSHMPVAIMVRDPALVRQIIHGVPVVGRFEELEAALQRTRTLTGNTNAALLFLQDPISDLNLEPEVLGRLRKAGHVLLRLPKPSDLAARGDVLKEIALEELLPREPVALDPSRLRDLVLGKRLMVTGAGGSIGSEICRQLAALGVGHLSLLDQSEFLLFEIDRHLAGQHPDLSRTPVLCDVRDLARVESVLSEERPDIIFHAAALKHVTLVELNPSEAVLTNILGTWNVASSAKKSGVGQLVLISTDKAVDPTSFMGATKRLAESLLPDPTARFRSCVVRFGNVLGSAGSVVPIFRQQIAKGGPVTVTHKDVTRYFMTIPEAVQLVLHAAAISAAGSTTETRKFVLDMGKPVSILSLARQLIELSGLRPEIDIPIEFSGLKPGEKLTEELLDSNEQTHPVDVGLSEIRLVRESGRLSPSEVARLAEAARSRSSADVREHTMQVLQDVRQNASRSHQNDVTAQ
ncbi:MAG: polysaccharide biosynthesis protein [Hyphomicrobiales bacterium]|nr:MAG: polysaccharide biosynthesis protein [Hyphomicrobiales bacterium]